jgi:asparaginyl-tRNA synthetase
LQPAYLKQQLKLLSFTCAIISKDLRKKNTQNQIMEVLKRQRVIDLLKGRVDSLIGSEINVKGWVRTKRGNKNVAFIALNDGSIIHNIQIVVDVAEFNNEELLKKVTTGSCISVNGKLVDSQGSGQHVEILANAIEVYGTADAETYPLQKKGHSLEFLREIAHLRPRTNTFGAILRIRHALAFAIHKYYNDRGFYYLHTPIITGSDAEGAGAMFRVTTLDLHNIPKTSEGKIDFEQDFFGKETNLTVSGQLEGELGALALSNIYTFGPTFRAENSNTTRHLAEFWMIEPEMAFYDINDNQDLAEDFLKYLIGYVLENCTDDLEFLQSMYDKELIERLKFVTENTFERLPYTRAIEILEQSGEKFEFLVKWGVDLQSEHERYLVEKHFKKPVILSDYPKDIKAFYMKQNDDGKTVRAMDVLFPKIGEIIGGSQREEVYEKLLDRIREMGIPEKDVWWYLETRKFGSAPHSGFGLGFERLMLFITGMGNIRDVIPFPRTPMNAEF